jgi:3-hydroxy-3-methylglutaryl CoA synthase
MDVGISYIDFYFPKNYLNIEEFSINRNIDGDKFKKRAWY